MLAARREFQRLYGAETGPRDENRQARYERARAFVRKGFIRRLLYDMYANGTDSPAGQGGNSSLRCFNSLLVALTPRSEEEASAAVGSLRWALHISQGILKSDGKGGWRFYIPLTYAVTLDTWRAMAQGVVDVAAAIGITLDIEKTFDPTLVGLACTVNFANQNRHDPADLQERIEDAVARLAPATQPQGEAPAPAPAKPVSKPKDQAQAESAAEPSANSNEPLTMLAFLNRILASEGLRCGALSRRQRRSPR